MYKKEVFNLHPVGWELDPLDEYFELTAMDYCTAQALCNYVLFFKLTDEEKAKIIPTIKRGLEKTLSQCRHLSSYIDKHLMMGSAFTKRGSLPLNLTSNGLMDLRLRGNTLRLTTLRNTTLFLNTWETLVCVFIMHHHHCANDVMEWAGELHQLAENCAPVWKCPENPGFPPWDPACLDRSGVIPQTVSEDQQADGPVFPLKNPVHRPYHWLLCHPAKSKTGELKRLVSPEDGSYQIPSYDAYMAFMWRVLTKRKVKFFNPDPKSQTILANVVNMRMRFHDLPVTSHMQYIRQITNSVMQETCDALTRAIAPIRDKIALLRRADSYPPMTTFPASALQNPTVSAVTNNLIIVYPPRTDNPPAGEDEGNEFNIAIEKEITDDLLEDPEWNRYFEFRGVDVDEKPLV
ncbi:hypothetical protein F4810DRAFT_721028 [Camillea tinctor]|nr:hypothetical protein F4810DRAFT_721028 [Camillea tinctor]